MVTDFLYDNNLFSDEAIGPAAERIFNSAQKNAEQIPSTLQSYMEQLRTVDKKIKHTVEAISNGMYHPSMKAQMDSLEEQRAFLQSRIDEIERARLKHLFSLEQIIHLLSLYKDIKNFPPEEKKRAVQLFIDHVIVSEDHVHITVVTNPAGIGHYRVEN